MSANLMINRDYSAVWLQANVLTQIQAMNGWGDDRIDFANLNLNDPKTKKYLQEQQQAEYLIACTMEWIAWQGEIHVKQQLQDKRLLLEEMERKAELAKDKFMDNLRQQVELVAKQPSTIQMEALSALFGHQKNDLQQVILQLEEEKEVLVELHKKLTHDANQIVNAISGAWQQRHEDAVEIAVMRYREDSEAFLEKKKDPEFQQKIADFKKLEEAYERQLNKYQERVRVAASDVSRLRYQKNKIVQVQKRLPAKELKLQKQRDKLKEAGLNEMQRKLIQKDIDGLAKELERDKKEIVNLAEVNKQLKEAQENKEAVLKAKAELGLDEMKEELVAQSEFNEDHHIAKNIHGGTIDSEQLKQALLQAKNNIHDIAQLDINKVVMHAVDAAVEAAKEEIKDAEEFVDQVVETVVGQNHFLTQLKLLNSNVVKDGEERFLKPSEIRAMNKPGNAIAALQADVLAEEVQIHDIKAAKAVIQAKHKVHKVEHQITAVDQSLLDKNKQLQAVEQVTHKLEQSHEGVADLLQHWPASPTAKITHQFHLHAAVESVKSLISVPAAEKAASSSMDSSSSRNPPDEQTARLGK